jgi:peptidyl-prolyl cis-trans isomerase B (cyclophilin B)
LHVRNFDSLVSTGFYDTTAFHRVIPGFVIQGGDPNSRHGNPSTWGSGQPGQPTVLAEFSAAKHVRGILSAARLGNNINSATSQFFICVATAANLDNQYSIYGKVLSGMNIVDTIVLAPRNAQDRPNLKHEMFVTRIGSNDTVPNPPLQVVPRYDSLSVDTSISVQLKWKAVKDAMMYELEIADEPSFATPIKSLKVANLNYSFGGMIGNTWYYWRLRTNNGGHFSAWSPTWKFFTLTDATNIKNYQAAVKKVEVFPNPSSDSFTFSNLGQGFLISIFDRTGRLIIKKESTGSTQTITMIGQTKGDYFYTITLGAREIAKGKLILN